MATQSEKYTFFWKKDSPFSQFHPAKFTVNGQLYLCAEQYMMHQKAVLFGDDEIAEKILNETKPPAMKNYGRKVKNFDADTWDKKCVDIVKTGNYNKFTQNKDLKDALMRTQGTILVEASPVDTIWGIGLAEDNPDAHHKEKWRGKNLLGYALTEVREKIINEK